MRRIARWQMWSGAVAVVGAIAVGGFGLSPAAAQSGPVSPVPATGTPALAATSTPEQVRQIVQCGSTMYAVGTFTQISQSGTTYPRSNVFSFSATAPYTITSWTPTVNGTVNSIALTSSCTHAYIGGSFTNVDGVTADNIAYIRTYNNTLVETWAHSANKEVDTVLLTPNGHLLAGGFFTSINGSTADPYYASLSPATGTDDGYLHLNVSGHYVYPGVGFNTTQVFNQQLSPDGRHVLVEGVFTKVESNPRQQIFMLNLGTHGNVSNWYSTEFNQFCSDSHPLYIRAAAWSPDESTIYIATTGFHPNNWNGQFPLTGLCDAVAAFPGSRISGLSHDWINYSGCDSFFSVAADSFAVYAGGHERWADNPNSCNAAGPGSIPARGMGGFTPGASGGSLLTNSSHTAGLYSRDRGFGADDMLVTSAGLWIASDNFDGADSCGGVSGLAGICFLRYG